MQSFVSQVEHYRFDLHNNTKNTISKMIMKEDINRLKVVLAEQDKTNKWLADHIGFSPATVSKWCTNYSQLSFEALIKNLPSFEGRS